MYALSTANRRPATCPDSSLKKRFLHHRNTMETTLNGMEKAVNKVFGRAVIPEKLPWIM
jgi:hypothetical protein